MQMKTSSRINKEQQVQVVIRLKPQPLDNKYQRCAYLASQDSNTLVVETSNKKEYFVFDAIAGENTSQFDIYHSIGREAVTQSLEGYNCCIFAYGQTGAGKTYSILGALQDISDDIYAESRGIMPRLLQDLFRQVNESSNRSFVYCSYMEIYNQQIFDLLNENVKFLQVRQDLKKGVFVQGLNQQKVGAYEDAINLVLQGEKNRRIAATSMNSESSRSHTIFTVNIETQIQTGEIVKTRRSKINIVDLAGSQRVKHTNVEGQRLKEGCNINKSLHVLGNVINALVESSKKKKHIPFRDSKLTYYLKDSLGGNSITKLLANIQTNKLYLGDTLSTLMFAKRAKILKMKVEVNEKTTQNYEVLRKQIKKLRQQLAQAKYINETRLSQRFPTENQTQVNIEKVDTSNFQYSASDKSLQVFEQNQLHYKTLIQIYEEQLKEYTAFNTQSPVMVNNFTQAAKKKSTSILTHSQWKKLQKKNLALTSLLKKMPAFTKIYRQNQLLKQQRNQLQKLKIQSQQKQQITLIKPLSFTNDKPQKIINQQINSTSIQLDEVSEHGFTHEPMITPRKNNQIIKQYVEKTSQKYEQIIQEMKEKFSQCLENLEQNYIHIEKQLQDKDLKIKEIMRKQQQVPPQIDQLIDQNEYLKLNILELEAQISELEKELDQAKIKHKEEGRRLSLHHEPLTAKKPPRKSETDRNNNWMSASLNFQSLPKQLNCTELFDSKQEESQKKSQKSQTQKCQQQPQTIINAQIRKNLEILKEQTLKQIQAYNLEKQRMIECIQVLQREYKKVVAQNKICTLKLEQLKSKNNEFVSLLKTLCEEEINLKEKISPKLLQSGQNLLTNQELWHQIQETQRIQKEFEWYKQNTQLQIDSLYSEIGEMKQAKLELEKFLVKEKAIQKQFGKSINEILDQYSEFLEGQIIRPSVVLSARGSSGKILPASRSSKLLNQQVGPIIRSTRQYNINNRRTHIQISGVRAQRNSSKNSSQASQQKPIFAYRSPKK